MVVVDEQSTLMWVQIKPSLIDRFRLMLHCGYVYVFRNYNVARVFEESRPVSRRYKIVFTLLTSVTKIDPPIPDLPMHVFQFVPLHTMKYRSSGCRVLTDIAGCVTFVGPAGRDAHGTPKLVLEMTSDFSTRFMLVLLGGATTRFTTQYRVGSVRDPVVFVFSSLEVHHYLGAFVFSSTCATHVYVNLQNDYVISLTDMCAGLAPRVPMFSVPIAVQDSTIAPLFDERMTISQINDACWSRENLGRTFIFAGTVSSLSTRGGWFFFGCRGCSRRLSYRDGHFTCTSCSTVATSPRILLLFSAFDDTGEVLCVAVNRVASRMIYTTADGLPARPPTPGCAYPPAILALAGRRFIFRFKVCDYNITYGGDMFVISEAFVPEPDVENLLVQTHISEEPGVDVPGPSSAHTATEPAGNELSCCSPGALGHTHTPGAAD